MIRLAGSAAVAVAIVIFGYYFYRQAKPEQIACDQAIRTSGDFGKSFLVRSRSSSPATDGITVNVIFSTTNAKGEALGNYYSCDLSRQADGNLKVVRVYPTPADKN